MRTKNLVIMLICAAAFTSHLPGTSRRRNVAEESRNRISVVSLRFLHTRSGAEERIIRAHRTYTFISDQGITGAPSFDNQLRFGNGLSFEANYARRVVGGSFLSVDLELPFVFNPDEDLHAALPNRIPEQYSSLFVTPAARLNVFSDQAVSPWISVGGGFGHFSESSTLLFGGTNTGPKGTTTGVFQAGLGLDVKIFGRFGLRLAARDFWSGVPQLNVDTGKSRQHNIFVAGGIVWHF